jgi:hypothetical protein
MDVQSLAARDPSLAAHASRMKESEGTGRALTSRDNGTAGAPAAVGVSRRSEARPRPQAAARTESALRSTTTLRAAALRRRGRHVAVAAVAAALVALPARADAKRLLQPDELRPRPRLQLAVSPVLGPYYRGEQDCRPRGPVYYCEDGGSFLGAGATIEARIKTFGPLYFQVRGLLVGNTHKLPYAVYKGLGGAGFGLGLYARLAFIRAEYLLIDTLGEPSYRPPFGEVGGATDVYGHHAGMLSGGVRLPFRERWNAELWGGFVFGPYARRDTPFEVSVADRLQVSFLAGAGFSFDVIKGQAKAR